MTTVHKLFFSSLVIVLLGFLISTKAVNAQTFSCTWNTTTNSCAVGATLNCGTASNYYADCTVCNGQPVTGCNPSTPHNCLPKVSCSGSYGGYCATSCDQVGCGVAACPNQWSDCSAGEVCCLSGNSCTGGGGGGNIDKVDFYGLENESIPRLRDLYGDVTIGEIVSDLVNTYAFPFVGILLLLYIVYGGFSFLSASGDPGKIASAYRILTNGLLGFAIIFGAYWIVQIVGIVLDLPEFTAIFS